MSAVDVALKRCRDCGETKALSQFNKNRRTRDGFMPRCRDCDQARVLRWKQAKREEMGDEAYRARENEIVARHRARTGNATGRRNSRFRNAAIAALIAAHRAEFDHLLTLARRGELGDAS